MVGQSGPAGSNHGHRGDKKLALVDQPGSDRLRGKLRPSDADVALRQTLHLAHRMLPANRVTAGARRPRRSTTSRWSTWRPSGCARRWRTPRWRRQRPRRWVLTPTPRVLGPPRPVAARLADRHDRRRTCTVQLVAVHVRVGRPDLRRRTRPAHRGAPTPWPPARSGGEPACDQHAAGIGQRRGTGAHPASGVRGPPDRRAGVRLPGRRPGGRLRGRPDGPTDTRDVQAGLAVLLVLGHQGRGRAGRAPPGRAGPTSSTTPPSCGTGRSSDATARSASPWPRP